MFAYITNIFPKPLSRIAFNIYIAGIAGSTVNGIIIHNKKLENKAKDVKYDVDYIDYSMETLVGAIIGGSTGIWWPLTAIGQCALAITKISTISKNN